MTDTEPWPAPRRVKHNGSILMAAMLGLANALGMEPKEEPVEIAQPADPDRSDDLDFNFGSLPPLN